MNKARVRFFSAESMSFLRSVFVPISVRQQIFIGIVVISLLIQILSRFVPFVLIFPLGMLGIHMLLFRLMDRPIRSLLQITRQGGFDIAGPNRVVDGRDEFSRVARAVFGMAKRMRRSIVEAREQTSRLDEIFGAIGEGVIIVSAEGKITKINNTVRRWVGFYGDVSGRHIVEVMRSVELAEKVTALAKRVANRKDDRIVEPEILESLHVDGPETRKVRAKIVAIQTDPENTVFMVFLFDVTDMHRLEQIRREFFANVSHELKTPIAAIRGYAEILHDNVSIANDEVARGFLAVITRNSQSLTKLIDEMMVLAGLESGALYLNIKNYDIRAALERMRETITPKARDAGIEIILDVSHEVQELLVDAQRFDSVILNLVDNGIKYNRKDGYVKVSVRQNDSDTLLYVEDSGLGLPDAAQLRAFERFYRVDKSHTRLGGGSGLGLAIVKHVVQAHGGSISLRSELGVGTVFTIVIPRQPQSKKINLLTPL